LTLFTLCCQAGKSAGANSKADPAAPGNQNCHPDATRANTYVKSGGAKCFAYRSQRFLEAKALCFPDWRSRRRGRLRRVDALVLERAADWALEAATILAPTGRRLVKALFISNSAWGAQIEIVRETRVGRLA
jgi:hypothetical protein